MRSNFYNSDLDDEELYDSVCEECGCHYDEDIYWGCPNEECPTNCGIVAYGEAQDDIDPPDDI